jgi:signal transduction histidine kinase/CheY-like chemotaxis protein
MNPVVAVCLICVVGSLMLSIHPSSTKRIQAFALASVVASAAICRIIATAQGNDKTIDTLLFAAKLDAELRPNRMAITTAWCLLASALAALSLATRFKYRETVAQAFSLATAITGVIVVNCYAAEVLAGQAKGTAVPMALNVAVLFIVFMILVVSLTPKSGPMSVIMAQSHSALFARRLLVSLLIAPPVLGWLTHWGQALGFYSTEYKNALLISVLTCGFAVNVWFGTRKNGQAESRLRQVEQELRASRDLLEERITARTAELTEANENLVNEMEERKALQEQFLQSQKMESLGALAGGVAHDFNNVLTGIMGYAELALMKLPADSNLRPDLEQIVRSSERAAGLTRQLLMFARREIVEPRVVDLNQLASELDSLLRRLIGVDIELVTLATSNLGSVKIDPAQFEQVLINLAVNARDAMPGSGQLIIQTKNVTIDMPQATYRGNLEPGEYVVLSVTDNGKGMSKEIQSRIFDPFFTTKEKGRGTGLGLSTCYGIIRESGGHISVYSEIGAGTTFRIYLPRVDSQPDLVPAIDLAQPLGGNETVLIVEDEDAVRTMGAAVLRESGYRVLEAADGRAALRVIAQHKSEIDLVITDVVMPGMGGRELNETLQVVRPGLPVLFTSGYTDDAMVLQGVLERDMLFLQKPFAPLRLLAKVREILDLPIAS